MRQFKDSTGKTWDLAINVGTIRRVRELTKVDLPKLFEDKCRPLADLLGNPELFVDVLFVIVKPQAEKVQITDIQFGESFTGDVLESAAEQFMEELIDFFPKAKATLRALMDKVKKATAKVEARTLQQVEGINEDALAEKLIASFGDVPESSASTPTPSLSVN